VTGLLVPPDDPASLADALNTLLRDPDRADAMGLAGRERAVTEFSWDTVAGQTAALYAELLAKAGAKPGAELGAGG
jgi:starch synthase